MNIQLIDGHFSPQDALSIMTQMVHVKIKYHESKISHADSEDDIKMREKRIKSIQRDLYEFQQFIAKHNPQSVSLHATVAVEEDAPVLV